MATSGQVELTIVDGGAGAVQVPLASLQVVMGCSSSGTAFAIVATKQPSTLQSTFGYGPLPEAAALPLQAGGTVLAMRLPTTTAGAIATAAAINIVSSTNASPIVVTATAHGLQTGYVTTIASHLVNTAAVGTWRVTRITADTFSLDGSTGNGIGGATGTSTWTGSIASGTGTTPIWFTGTPVDDYYPLVTVVTGGTAGTTGIQITISLDAGRTTNLPRINLGTALTYAIPNTGLTLNVTTAKTLVAGDTSRCVTTAPLPSVADISTGLTTLLNSPYAAAGWGSMHLVGKIGGSDSTTVGTALETMAGEQVYTRMIGESRDATPPTAWGGTGETDAAWAALVIADFSAVTQKRFGVSAGYYNMRSAFPNSAAGLPLYRRPLAWAWAARIVSLPQPADHEGWVRLGALPQITLDPVLDPLDGFVYHNELAGVTFDGMSGGAGRLAAAQMRRNTAIGWYMANPLMLAAPGSDYQLAPRGRVIDLASTVIVATLTPFINERLKANRNKTIREANAVDIEKACYRALDVAIGDQISGRTVVVDRDWNIVDTNVLKITGTIGPDPYALEIDLTLGFGAVAA